MLSAYENLPILIIGDVILDHYLIGKVERISPEAPVLVVNHENEEYRLGGAANVALNIKALGAVPILMSVIGQDTAAQNLSNLLIKNNIDNRYLQIEEDRQTTIKTRILARQQQLLRYDKESTHSIKTETAAKILTEIKNLLAQKAIKAVIFQDYNKGVLTTHLIKEIINLCKQNHIPTVTDPKKDNFWAYSGVSLFKPNLREVNEALGTNTTEKQINIENLQKISNQLQARLVNEWTCITLGAKGIFIQKNNTGQHFSTQERAVADVCGAGDTVVSVLALGLAAGQNMNEVAQLANLAGGQVCEKIGVVAVDKNQLVAELASTNIIKL
jgi:D-glycero-beta-D-manno-heptose-7-phosphate kinase